MQHVAILINVDYFQNSKNTANEYTEALASLLIDLISLSLQDVF